jgi:hypothetical protein
LSMGPGQQRAQQAPAQRHAVGHGGADQCWR